VLEGATIQEEAAGGRADFVSAVKLVASKSGLIRKYRIPAHEPCKTPMPRPAAAANGRRDNTAHSERKEPRSMVSQAEEHQLVKAAEGHVSSLPMFVRLLCFAVFGVGA